LLAQLQKEGTKGTKDTKDTKNSNNNKLLLAQCRMVSVSQAPFVPFVPSW